MSKTTNLTISEKGSPGSGSKTSSSTDSSTNNQDKERLRRQLVARIFYTDYSIQENRKFIGMAKLVIESVYFRELKDDADFIDSIRMQYLFDLNSLEKNEQNWQWNLTITRELKKLDGNAVNDSISFFAVGDIKFLLYKTMKT
ncbi:unnamed protein product [Caenorhabditis angaria]|uniref:Uncharacterized protein n=1 Tax=Caenorhabditis angaria TaxID=860376 RepID=A0A9P1IQV6_9PELO|nr:unnamed protein product [Caenorhabditis angaria]